MDVPFIGRVCQPRPRGGERAERLLQLGPRVSDVAGTRCRRLFSGRRAPQLNAHPAASSVRNRAISRTHLAEKRLERESRRLTGVDQLVRLDVAALVEEHVLEDAAPQRWQPPQVAFAQGCTYLREDVHYVVIVLGVVANGREDEAPIAVEKQVPRGVGSGRRQVDRPPFHPHDLQGDLVGYTLNAGSVKG